MKKALFILLAVSLGSIVPAAPTPYDFTFHVPIELHSIPPQVRDWQVSAMVDTQYGDPIGGEVVNFIVIDGEYSQTLTIAFNAMSGKNPGAATKYTVTLLCLDPQSPQGSQYQIPHVYTMRLNGPYPYDNTKPYIPFLQKTLSN